VRVDRRRESAGIIFGGGARVRGIEEATFYSCPEVKGNAVIIGHTIILGVVDGPKTRIKAGRKRIRWRSNQIAGNGINVHALGNLTAEVAISHEIGGVGSAVKYAGNEMAAKPVFKGSRKNIRGGGHDVRVNPADG